MALTAKRREELAVRVDTAASWIQHSGRAAELRSIAAELRGEEHDEGETEAQVSERLDEAAQVETEAQETAKRRRGSRS